MRLGVIRSWTVAACLKNAGQVTCEYDMRVATNYSFGHIIPTMRPKDILQKLEWHRFPFRVIKAFLSLIAR